LRVLCEIYCSALDQSKEGKFVECAKIAVLKVSEITLGVLNWFILHDIAPGKPEVSVEQPEETVVVSWTLQAKNGVIKNYHVTYINEDDSSDIKSRTTQEIELQFDNLMAGKTYEFQVFAMNNIGKGPAGAKTFTLRAGSFVKLLS